VHREGLNVTTINRSLILRGLNEVKTPRDLRVASTMLREGADQAEARGERGFAAALREAYKVAQSGANTKPRIRKALEAIRALIAQPTREELAPAWGLKGHILMWCGDSYECTRCGQSGSLATTASGAPVPDCLRPMFESPEDLKKSQDELIQAEHKRLTWHS
jgi:hypothetical protein